MQIILSEHTLNLIQKLNEIEIQSQQIDFNRVDVLAWADQHFRLQNAELSLKNLICCDVRTAIAMATESAASISSKNQPTEEPA